MKGYFRKRGEKWSFTIDVGLDPAMGKRKQKTVSGFKTKKEAQLAAAAFHQELSVGAYYEEKEILFKDFVEEWMKIYSMSVKVSTVRVRKHESGHLLNYFENIKTKNITKKMYQDALMDLHSKGLAHNTISGIHATGRMIFGKAIELELSKMTPPNMPNCREPRKPWKTSRIKMESSNISKRKSLPCSFVQLR